MLSAEAKNEEDFATSGEGSIRGASISSIGIGRGGLGVRTGLEGTAPSRNSMDTELGGPEETDKGSIEVF